MLRGFDLDLDLLLSERKRLRIGFTDWPLSVIYLHFGDFLADSKSEFGFELDKSLTVSFFVCLFVCLSV